MMYNYKISGHYFEYDKDNTKFAKCKPFDFEIEAPDNVVAMQIALGRIMLSTESPVKLDVIHYECL